MKVAIFADHCTGGKTAAIVGVPTMADHAREVELSCASVVSAARA